MSFSEGAITRLRDAFASLAPTAEARADCPEPERVWRAAAGEVPSAEIRALVDHTAGCPSCAEEWRLARELVPNVQGSVANFPVERRAPRSGWWLAAAAAGLLVVAGVPLWRASLALHGVCPWPFL